MPNDITPEESAQNYASQQAQYLAQLNRRLAAGQISQSFYNSQLAVTRDSLPDSSDGYWQEFLQTVSAEVRSPTTAFNNDVAWLNGDTADIFDTPTATSSDVAGQIKTAWSNAGGSISNFLSGLNSTIQLYLLLGIVGLVALIFFRKPLIKFFLLL